MYERRTKEEKLTKANIHRYETQEIDKHHQRSNEQDTRLHQRHRAENGESRKTVTRGRQRSQGWGGETILSQETSTDPQTKKGMHNGGEEVAKEDTVERIYAL